MYNILIAVGAAVVAFVVGWLSGGWIAGFIPALLAGGGGWVLLARRSGKQLEALFQRVGALLQAGKIDEARVLLESGFPLGKWQILVNAQIHSQLGAIDYMQGIGHTMQRQASAAKAKFDAAKGHLAKAWSRDWRARATLAAIHHRQGEPDAAVAVLEKASSAGASEPLFWALYAHVLNEARRRDEALEVLGRALAANKDNKPLQEIQAALANKKRPSMRVIGESWYQMFPEDIPREQLMQMHGISNQPRPQKTFPQPRGFGPPR